MDMDLITGIVVITAVFLVAIAVMAHAIARIPGSGGPDDPDFIERLIQRHAHATFVPLLIAFFVGLADILVTAKLPVIAFLNVAVGAATVAILFSTSQRRGDGEHWRH